MILEENSQGRDLQLIINSIPGGLFSCTMDEALTLQFMSEGFLSMIGYTQQQLREECHNSLKKLILEEDLKRTLQDVEEQMKLGNTKLIEYRVRCRDGKVIWLYDKGQRVTLENGEVGFYCIVIDITEQIETERELMLSLERHRIIMEQTNDIIFEWPFQGSGLSISGKWKEVFGSLPGALGEIPAHPNDLQRLLDLLKGSKTPGKRRLPDVDLRMKTVENDYKWYQLRITLQYDEKGHPIKYIGLLRDIDRDKRRTEKLMMKAERDELTGLYNRGAARRLIEYIMEDKMQGLHALLIIDLDNFKTVNDTKGHLYGDAVLANFAQRLKKIFRSSDIVSRYGGDEFIVFLNGIRKVEDAREKAEEILQITEKLSSELRENFPFTCSVGGAIFPEDAIDFKALFQKADTALYRAKEWGKNKAVFESAQEYAGHVGGMSTLHTAIDSERAPGGLENNLINSAFDLLYDAGDLEAALQLLMEIMGRQFSVSRVYIFEFSSDQKYFSNTFEWCNEGIVPEMDQLQNLPIDGYDNYMGNFDERGIFYCTDINQLPSSQREILGNQGIKAVLQCSISDGRLLKGFIGFDECGENRYWDKSQVLTLARCARIVGVFLSKLRMQERIEGYQKNPNR